ncbi:hypothetical protein BWI96_13200 [Siphonobacter sp. SORGH_AS_0500]|nr:hypothetical protein BWI96_13200 [Siphonobacter sp. SORGH_AS_0500]
MVCHPTNYKLNNKRFIIQLVILNEERPPVKMGRSLRKANELPPKKWYPILSKVLRFAPNDSKGDKRIYFSLADASQKLASFF